VCPARRVDSARYQPCRSAGPRNRSARGAHVPPPNTDSGPRVRPAISTEPPGLDFPDARRDRDRWGPCRHRGRGRGLPNGRQDAPHDQEPGNHRRWNAIRQRRIAETVVREGRPGGSWAGPPVWPGSSSDAEPVEGPAVWSPGPVRPGAHRRAVRSLAGDTRSQFAQGTAGAPQQGDRSRVETTDGRTYQSRSVVGPHVLRAGSILDWTPESLPAAPVIRRLWNCFQDITEHGVRLSASDWYHRD
jgi:hypothetical protein